LLRDLKKIYQLSKDHIDIYATFIADLPSLLFVLVNKNFLNLSANFYSLFSLFLGLLASFFVIFENIKIAILFFYFSLIFDFVDGKVARLQKTSSIQGKRIDIMVDRTIFVFLSFSYLYYLFDNKYSSLIFFLFLGAIFIFLLHDTLNQLNLLVNITKQNNSKVNAPIIKKTLSVKISSAKSWIPRNISIFILLFMVLPYFNFNLNILLLLLFIIFGHFLKDFFRTFFNKKTL